MKNVTDGIPALGDSRQDFLDDVAVALSTIPGHTHRVVRTKLVRTSLGAKPGEVTPLHHEILHLLATEGKTNPAEIGRRLQVAKAQITKLINKLVELGLIERKIDPRDKRVYNVNLTQKGKRFTRKQRKHFNSAIEALTFSFSDDELRELAVSLRTVHVMLCRME